MAAGRPPLFSDEEKEWLRQLVTQNRHTRRLSLEETGDAIGYTYSPDLVRDTMVSMGYHKRKPRQKYGIRPQNYAKRVKWPQERLHWTYEEY